MSLHRNDNGLQVKVVYPKRLCVTNCNKTRLLKMGVPIFKGHPARIVEQFLVYGK